ncbi:MAG: CHAT domain-containing protein, partial [Cyanobacteria bacterium]|nr:CHAT domain-containing protein [Cyanobacteriota bacterium]
TETAISGSSDERRVTVQLAQAQALLHNNRALESIENLQRAIKEYDSRNFANSGQTKSAGRKGISDELMAELYLALAKCQFEARKHEEARLSLNRAMDLTRTRRSQLVIPRVIEELFGLALCNAELGDHDSATNLAFQAAGVLKEYISNGFPILSFAEQRSFLQKIKVYTSTILALCNDERSLPEAYWYLMRWRGMLVEALRNQSLLSNRSTDVSVAPIYRQWLETRHELARIAASQSQNPSLTAKVKELSQTKESLERQLLGGQQNVDPIAGMEVMEFSDILQPDEAFVDLFVYQPVGQGSSNAPQTGSIAIDTTSSAAHFAAIVVYRDVVKFVDIPHADKISQAIGQWREFGLSSQSRDVSVDESYGDGTDSDRTKADKAWSTLQSLLWLPVLNAVHPEATKLIICEDQELSRIPWSNMADQFSLGRKFLVTHVDSPRELVVLREKAAKSKTPKAIAMSDSKVLLVGDIEYKHSLLKLPGTALEVDAIEKLISDQNDSHLVLEAPPLRGKLATKDQVRRLLPDATIAHLGTHGFFAEDDPVDADMSRSLLRSSSAIGSLTASRNPLVSSGILLAPDSSLQMRNGDSNSSIPSDTKQVALTISTEGGDVTIDDEGRLTAEEIIDLDLRKCNLVVLSACNTGRGTEERGQGILGLRSAFMAAGTRTIMLSLWPVDDESTRYLMTEFYKQLWINKKCKAEALKLAQESVKTNKDHPEWKNPFYWAAWVLVGEGW